MFAFFGNEKRDKESMNGIKCAVKFGIALRRSDDPDKCQAPSEETN